MKPKSRVGLIQLIIFLLFSNSLFAQNLVPNPGFEQFTGCPSGSGELNLAAPWTSAGAPADLFSTCHINSLPASCSNVGVPLNFAGSTLPNTGSNYSGFFTKRQSPNQRNYIRAPLNSPLVSGQLYQVSAYFKRSQNSPVATNRIGICLSTSSLSQAGNDVINITPQFEVGNVIADTSSWFTFTDFYVASGGEAHITIGNFRNDAATTSFNFSIPPPACTNMGASAFYYTDNISITPINEQLSISGDTLICIGDSATLTGNSNTAGWWSASASPNDTIPSAGNSITVEPATSATYIWNGIMSSINVTVNVIPPPVVNLPSDSTICEGSSITLNAAIPGANYIWSTGSNASSISISDSGSYIVTVSNGACAVRDTFHLELIPAPEITLPVSTVICPDNGEFVTLNAGIGESYQWLPIGDTTASIIVNSEGTYSVIVTHQGGCTRSASVEVTELCRETVFVPGGFTPNGDGVNDLFFAEGTGVINFKMKIFNRWGQLIFETARLGIAGGWNGLYLDQSCPVGTYVFRIQYDAIQANGKKKRFTRSGPFSLIY